MIDLRSDTVTKPTPEMLAFMMAAKLGDDVYEEDPTVRTLEDEVAAILNKEAALFVPSGTMANQIAIHLHCRRGETILATRDAHIFRYESGAAAALSGVQFDFLSKEATLDTTQAARPLLEANFRAQVVYQSPTRLFALENTHNSWGGLCIPQARVNELCQAAKDMGLTRHCDGARLWNAAIAQDLAPSVMIAPFDSVSVCFSKGLGAPVGSCVSGSRDFIKAARWVRKQWGGGMRQVGLIAAGALYALRHHQERLALDHVAAGTFHEQLRASLGPDDVCESIYPPGSTNMVFIESTPELSPQIMTQCKAEGLLVSDFGNGRLRCVFHLDIKSADVARAAEIITRVAKSLRSR